MVRCQFFWSNLSNARSNSMPPFRAKSLPTKQNLTGPISVHRLSLDLWAMIFCGGWRTVIFLWFPFCANWSFFAQFEMATMPRQLGLRRERRSKYARKSLLLGIRGMVVSKKTRNGPPSIRMVLKPRNTRCSNGRKKKLFHTGRYPTFVIRKITLSMKAERSQTATNPSEWSKKCLFSL